jgi:cell division protein FtsA
VIPPPHAPELVAGLDVGTSAIKIVVARRRPGAEPSIVGMGMAPAAGIRRGVVVHLEEASAAVARAIAEAELTAGVALPDVDLALGGGHITCMNSRAVVTAAGPGRCITSDDAARAIAAARAVALPDERAVLDAIPQEFVVDDQPGVADPAGMAGTRLEVNLHVVTGSVAAILNLAECVSRCGVTIRDVSVAPVAAAHAVLSADERSLGAAVVDIGAGTSGVALFDRGALVYTAVLPAGGDHLTDDLAVALRTPVAEAERIKRRMGRTFTLSLDEGQTLWIPPIAGTYDREVSKKLVPEILATAAHALLDRIADEVARATRGAALPAGVVLTGGSAALGGLADTAEAILGQSVRWASPQASGSIADAVNTSSFSTAVGLVLRASHALDDDSRAPDCRAHRRARVIRRLRRAADWIARARHSAPTIG